MGCVGNLRLILLPCPGSSAPSTSLLIRQRLGHERLPVQPVPKVLLPRCLLIVAIAASPMRPADVELQIDLAGSAGPSARGTVRAALVRSQSNFVLEHDEARRQTHGMRTQKVLPIKVARKRLVVLEELVRPALLVADVALVVLLVEMLVQARQIVESARSAELAQRMAGETGTGPVAVGLVRLELGGGEAGELTHEIAPGRVAQVAQRQVVLGPEVGVEGLHAGLPLDLPLLLGVGFGIAVLRLGDVRVRFVGKVAVGDVASQGEDGEDGGNVVVGGEEHADIVPEGEALAESVMCVYL